MQRKLKTYGEKNKMKHIEEKKTPPKLSADDQV